MSKFNFKLDWLILPMLGMLLVLLAWNISTFGLLRGIAVYNAWDQRSAPAAGPFKNQAYVDKVRAKARALGLEI